MKEEINVHPQQFVDNRNSASLQKLNPLLTVEYIDTSYSYFDI